MRSESSLKKRTGEGHKKYSVRAFTILCVLTGVLGGCEKPPDLFGTKGNEEGRDKKVGQEQTTAEKIKDRENASRLFVEPYDNKSQDYTRIGNEGESGGKDPQAEYSTGSKDRENTQDKDSYLVEGAHVSRRPIQTDMTGVWGLEILLDNEKINKVNQRRDVLKIEERPDLFGINSDFKPLFLINTNKKGLIEISSKSLGKILIETSDLPESLEIYPFFDMISLLEDKGEEEIEIVFIEGERRSLIERTKLSFSRPNEIFAEDSNLSDIASFTKNLKEELETKDDQERYTKLKSSTDVIRAAIGGLEKYNIEYEKWMDRSGYKKVRKPEESKKEKNINDLEFCIWLSAVMKQAKLDPIIIITENSILLGIKEHNSDNSSSTLNYLDPETLLNKEKINKQEINVEDYIKYRIDKSIIKGNHIMKEEFERSPNKIFALDIKEWENLFRSN